MINCFIFRTEKRTCRVILCMPLNHIKPLQGQRGSVQRVFFDCRMHLNNLGAPSVWYGGAPSVDVGS
ncbi:hypothetical protein N7532_002476 [Penicillium argentinense]|uniref:Uncharacterized protein n=1 Tax=Penicillium argentinense TaxID=1131581 RepID=A0A9W9KLA1_9EURO|nr:uncharacterized protein N7532_002476 [Penicillium argentinense]KAJ5109831.1 hypothetical protein N7532_002476 [Penicillium argentinense]